MLALFLVGPAFAEKPPIEPSAPPAMDVAGVVPEYPALVRRLHDGTTGYADCSVRVTISGRGEAVDADVLDCPILFQEEMWTFLSVVRWEAPVVDGHPVGATFVYRHRFEHPSHPADEPMAWEWHNDRTDYGCLSAIVIWSDGVVTALDGAFPEGCELEPKPVIAPPIAALPSGSTLPVAFQCTVSFEWSRSRESVDVRDVEEPYPCRAFTPMIADAVLAQVPRMKEPSGRAYIPHLAYYPPKKSLERRHTILVFLEPRPSSEREQTSENTRADTVKNAR